MGYVIKDSSGCVVNDFLICANMYQLSVNSTSYSSCPIVFDDYDCAQAFAFVLDHLCDDVFHVDRTRVVSVERIVLKSSAPSYDPAVLRSVLESWRSDHGSM